jgi:hypothetical protein
MSSQLNKRHIDKHSGHPTVSDILPNHAVNP